MESGGLGLFAIFMLGLIGGAILVGGLYRYFHGEKPPTSWICVALFSAAIMVVAAFVTDQLSFARAVLVIPIGSAALVAAARAIEMINRGETIELSSNWGGLGGALGGWRLSPVTTLIIVALALTGSAVGIVLGTQPAASTAHNQDESKNKGDKVKKDTSAVPPSPVQDQKQDAPKPTVK